MMEKSYDPGAIEQRWYGYWIDHSCFQPSGHGQPYCIMLPPPNVTGRLHMGHAFQDTIMDTLTRWQRMKGSDTLWQPGTDHAGIATQMVVERQLLAEGTSRHKLGREDFVQAVWDWKEQSGDTISRQMSRLGASVDWSRHRFTMDEELSRAVQLEFVTLYEEGLIYRGKRLVNWDPVLHTALSDLEVRARYSAAVGVMALVLVPFIHVTVYWFRTLHPAPVVLKPDSPSLPGVMLTTLLISIGVFTVLYVGFLLLRYALAVLEDVKLEEAAHELS